MDDFASTAMYDLIAAQLRKFGMDVQPSQRFEGKTERVRKSDLLSTALETLGAGAIVEIGQGIHGAEADPTLNVLLSADTPAEFLARWQRLEHYYHGKHRVRVLDTTARSLVLEHYSTRPTQPSAGEDLVVAGLLAALLQRIGCRRLSLFAGSRKTAYIRDDVVTGTRSAPDETAVWRFSWKRFERRQTAALPEVHAGTTTEALTRHVKADIGRNWRVGEAAAVLCMSTRTLQRALAGEGSNFQQVLRTTRAECAATAIASSEMTLAGVGYACGFSDQAHFSRDFKLRFNMSPSEFAALSVKQSPTG